MRNAIFFISGFIFSLGLGISGMTHPEKVKAFLNVLGNWDPSLLVVLFSAVSTYAVGNFIFKNMEESESSPKLPEVIKGLDIMLLGGSALFGIGWGIIGLCPGPALVDLASVNENILLFVLAMTAGFILANMLMEKLQSGP
ncbi:MAG: putative membrane protein YedE/YeeE [Chlamydiales bacterium]|jgi:uncharacterized membrane protein YedE/YeeE